ncbi:MAG: protein kinase [Archangium sp.]
MAKAARRKMLIATPPGWQAGDLVGGRFTLLGRLAFGGMAELWLARQGGPQGFSRLVVVKRVLEARSNDRELLDMFIEEAQLGARLQHPNIVHTVDFGEEADVPFIVLEYLFGETFARVLRESRVQSKDWPALASARVISDAALGLASAHELKGLDGQLLNIVHRDVSPQNLFVTVDGLVKVIDFGIARAVDRRSHTEHNQLRGRVAFMSPEQISSQPLDARADVFALGLVLWEAVTGGAPDASNDPVAIMHERVSERPIPRARSRNAAISEALDEVIARSVEKDLTRRFQTAREFHEALEGVLKAEGDVPTVQVAALLSERFKDKHAARSQLVQRLVTETSTARLSTSTIRALRTVTEDMRAVATPPSAADVTTGSNDAPAAEPKSIEIQIDETPQRKSKVPWAIAALLLLGLGIGGLAAWYARQDRSQPEVVAALPSPRVDAPAQPQPTPTPTQQPEAPKVPEPTNVVTPSVPAVPKDPEVKVVPRTPKTGKPAAATGLLRIDTVPWTQVYLKGRKLGDTPLVDVPVPAGELELTLVNDEEKIRTVIGVEIIAGQITTKRLQF